MVELKKLSLLILVMDTSTQLQEYTVLHLRAPGIIILPKTVQTFTIGELGGVPTCVKIVMVFLWNVIIPRSENTLQKDAPGRRTFQEIFKVGKMDMPTHNLDS